MKKTLCRLSLTNGSQFYLIQNDQNNLEVSANPEGMQPQLYASVVVTDTHNQYQNNFGEKFLSGEIFNDNTVSVLCNATPFKSLKDLLEKGLNIPQHQMPNLPNNNQHNQQDQIVVNNNPSVLMDMNTLLSGNEHYSEYTNSDFIFTEEYDDPNNGQAIDYSKRVGQVTYYYPGY